MSGSGNGRSLLGYAGLSLAWMVVLGVVLLITRRPSGQPIEILPPPTVPPSATPAPSPTPAPLHVDVAGAVRAPGVYVLVQGSRIADAIAAAGGPAVDADLDRINKAVQLQDGAQVLVPRIGQAIPAAPSPPSRSQDISPQVPEPAAADHRVNLNTATAEELDTLPGVGPSIAQSIIAGRPYAAAEDLLRVKGIGPVTFEKLKDLITVQ